MILPKKQIVEKMDDVEMEEIQTPATSSSIINYSRVDTVEIKETLDDNRVIITTNNLITVESNSDQNSIQQSKTIKYQIKNLNYKRILENFCLFMPTIIGSIVYMLTLKSCYDSMFDCLKKYPPKVMLYAFYIMMFSALMYITQVLLYIFKKVSIIYVLIETAIILLLCFVYDTGSNMVTHGAYNRIALFVCMLIWVLVFLLAWVFYKIWRKIPIIMTIVSVFALGYMILRVHYVFSNSCNDWNKGFNGTFITNDEEICIIETPNVCYFRILDGVFDISRITDYHCKTSNTDRYDLLQPFLKNSNAKRIGYPITTDWNITEKCPISIFPKNVLNSLIDMDDPTIERSEKDRVEIIVDFSQQPAKVDINVKRNETLVKERAEIMKNNTEMPLAKNVIHFFIDSISRASFKTKLKKLWSYLDSKYANKKGDSETFQFFKLQALGRYTRFNMFPTYYGEYSESTAKSTNMIKYYKEKGFITGSSIDFCSKEFYEVEDKEPENIEWSSYDHESQSLFCDPNFTDPKDFFSFSKGGNSLRKKCIYNQFTVNFSLSYLEKFWETYQDQSKYFRLGIIDSHEGTYESIKYDDEIFLNFFKKFEENGNLKDTIIIIQTDHGLVQPGIYSALYLDDYHSEVSLPALYMLIPRSIPNFDSIKLNLRSNEESFITPFNIHNTFISILNDERIPSSNVDKYSLFDHDIPPTRDCNILNIDSSLCRCKFRK